MDREPPSVARVRHFSRSWPVLVYDLPAGKEEHDAVSQGNALGWKMAALQAEEKAPKGRRE